MDGYFACVGYINDYDNDADEVKDNFLTSNFIKSIDDDKRNKFSLLGL